MGMKKENKMKTLDQISQSIYGKNYKQLPDDGAEQDHAQHEFARQEKTLNEKLSDLRTADEKFFAEAFTNAVTGQPKIVPDDIKRLATRICRSYGIRGICDPMYIANVAAVELKRGDGFGNFKDGGLNAEATKLVGARLAELESQKKELRAALEALNLAYNQNRMPTLEERRQCCAALAKAKGGV